MSQTVKNAAITAKRFFEEMQNPAYRGPKFDERTFDIEAFVGAHLPMMCRRRPSQAIMDRAVKEARRVWDELTDARSVDSMDV